MRASSGSSLVASSNIVDDTITNADVNSAAAIALSKLASDPLARANHTGTQLKSTISDLRAEPAFPGTQAFSGTSPITSFAALDLSAIVGAAKRVCLLKITNGTTSSSMQFQTNGLGGGIISTNSLHRVGALSSGVISYVLVTTDANGIVEWISSAASTTTTVDVVAHW